MNTQHQPPPAIHDTTRDHAEDTVAIREIISDIEAGFNRNDAELSVYHFAASATAVSVAGVLVSGSGALLGAHQKAFRGPLRDQHALYELEDITYLRPDIAIGRKVARETTPTGQAFEGGQEMVALYVFVKQEGRWWVAARQNTMRTKASIEAAGSD